MYFPSHTHGGTSWSRCVQARCARRLYHTLLVMHGPCTRERRLTWATPPVRRFDSWVRAAVRVRVWVGLGSGLALTLALTLPPNPDPNPNPLWASMCLTSDRSPKHRVLFGAPPFAQRTHARYVGGAARTSQSVVTRTEAILKAAALPVHVPAGLGKVRLPSSSLPALTPSSTSVQCRAVRVRVRV